MFETITVEQAIAKAKRNITYPAFILCITVIILGVVAFSVFQLSGWYIAAAVVAGFAVMWLYWSFAIVKWRLWAFDNVRNVHSLKKKAIKEQLIWPDGNWMSKTEIWSSSQRKQWSLLELKFDQPDIFTDDLTVEQETLIYYAKGKNFLEMVFMLAVLGAGIYMIVQERNYVWGGLISLFGAGLAFREFKQATNTKVQIRINAEGIETAEVTFRGWGSVYGEDVVRKQSGKNTYTYLIYNYPGGNVELLIDDFKISKKHLEHLLEVYRGRYENKDKSNQVHAKSTFIV